MYCTRQTFPLKSMTMVETASASDIYDVDVDIDVDIDVVCLHLFLFLLPLPQQVVSILGGPLVPFLV